MTTQIEMPATFSKPAFLLSEKSDIIAERDYMEANWQDSMRQRMITVSMISATKFKTVLSELK